MNKQAVIILARNPQRGKVKTRLASTIGDEQALTIYRELLLYTASATALLPVDKYVYYSDYIEDADIWNDQYYNKCKQKGTDVGERMRNAFAEIFDKGHEMVMVIGTDCPQLGYNTIMDGFTKLKDFDVVIGPAVDGGYYLLGLKSLHETLFLDIEWSSANVLSHTMKKCSSLQLSCVLLPEFHDIDEEKDLVYLKRNGI